ncbi:hypothetical protein K7X08_002498 [Anisodus acutangulus]|uniref:Uncharacterized protein n=1 Tax=Anisodus acutangulus TaxID=402998 RepID=A0A9Q1LPK2_9SOLA|nr:hypothetical protein K7X08_002498 [Anisodus acutangulus]
MVTLFPLLLMDAREETLMEIIWKREHPTPMFMLSYSCSKITFIFGSCFPYQEFNREDKRTNKGQNSTLQSGEINLNLLIIAIKKVNITGKCVHKLSDSYGSWHLARKLMLEYCSKRGRLHGPLVSIKRRSSIRTITGGGKALLERSLRKDTNALEQFPEKRHAAIGAITGIRSSGVGTVAKRGVVPSEQSLERGTVLSKWLSRRCKV